MSEYCFDRQYDPDAPAHAATCIGSAALAVAYILYFSHPCHQLPQLHVSLGVATVAPCWLAVLCLAMVWPSQLGASLPLTSITIKGGNLW